MRTIFIAGYQVRPLPQQPLNYDASVKLCHLEYHINLKQRVCPNNMTSLMTASVQNSDTSPVSCTGQPGLVDNSLITVSPDRRPSVAASTEPSHILASCTHAPACSPKSCNRWRQNPGFKTILHKQHRWVVGH